MAILSNIPSKLVDVLNNTTVIVPNGAQVSNTLTINGNVIAMLIPSNWDGGNVTFTSIVNGPNSSVNSYNVKDSSGNLVTFATNAGEADQFALDQTTFIGVTRLQVNIDTPTTADRTVQFIMGSVL